ncbi:TPA: tail fiber protein, partial [Klebsiella oxytoca]|nr:tail fiber protein [Klebsiella oxytoca]
MQSLMPPVDAPNNEFSDGNPSLGTLGTIVRALFLNNVQDAIRSVQRELLSILAAANINPDGDSNNQVLQAINKIMVDSNMSVPYGIPLPWPTSTPPTGYLICNGASFSAATYPNLAAVYTGGSLPDLRGQTIKGLPASGRALLSLEADGNKAHTHGASATETDLGTKTTSSD